MIDLYYLKNRFIKINKIEQKGEAQDESCASPFCSVMYIKVFQMISNRMILTAFRENVIFRVFLFFETLLL